MYVSNVTSEMWVILFVESTAHTGTLLGLHYVYYNYISDHLSN